MTAAPKDLASSLHTLSIHPTPSKSSPAFAKPQSTSKKPSIADSWEDDASSSDTETESSNPPHSHLPSHSRDETPLSPSFPSVPPPTPISPSHSSSTDFANPFGYPGDGASAAGAAKNDGKRQEKTDAVARRMIAGALGVRAPKKTDEQKEYEKAAKEKELRRRKEEKEEAERRREEEERRKREVWEG
ncbi:ubiquitin smt3 protein [Rutstroemia sp. NJR-2017a WRK4]|nr:ubiquitin smt3 protein [Rutstroemia sp. NJR-2017a WRK4]